MKRLAFYAAVVVLAAMAAAGCATAMSVSSHVDRSLDFSGYRTFDWGPADALPTGDLEPSTDKLLWRGWAEGSIDGVIDDQAWMESRIDQAVAKILMRLPHRL